MNGTPFRWLLALGLLAGALGLVNTGCANERREVRVEETQEEGEVREEAPGEMIVE
jgi:uncharacterized protein (DUF58 family)